MVAAWLSAARGGGCGADGERGGGGEGGSALDWCGGGGGRRARYFLAAVRARAYMKRGRHEQALRDARVAVAYAPTPKRQPPTPLGQQRLLPSSLSGTTSHGRNNDLLVAAAAAGDAVDNFSAASRAAAAHALLATALEAVAAEANVGDVELDADHDVFSTRSLSDDDEDDDAAGGRGGGRGGGGGAGHHRHRYRHHLDTGRTHASTGGLARVVLSAAGEGGRAEALIVDAPVAAAVEWRRAVDFAPDNRRYAAEFIRAAAQHLSEKPRQVLVERGADAAVTWFEKDKWANAPEYVRPRPKYYYFYEWMRERIGEHYPSLPEPVMDKLLATDAGELDLLLQYPKAIQGQVEEYLDVYRANGGDYLETYRTPQLTWQEVKAMKGRGTIGLGAAGEVNGFGEDGPPRPQSRLAGVRRRRGDRRDGDGGAEDSRDGPGDEEEEEEEDTDRAMLGAAGDDGLTAEEAAGLLMNQGAAAKQAGRGPSLPPDQLRTAHHVAAARAAGNTKYLPTGGASAASVSARAAQPPRTPDVDVGSAAAERSRRVDAVLGRSRSGAAAKGITGGATHPAGSAETSTRTSEVEVSTASASAAFTVLNMDDMD